MHNAAIEIVMKKMLILCLIIFASPFLVWLAINIQTDFIDLMESNTFDG